jgi:acetyl esterase/lipase
MTCLYKFQGLTVPNSLIASPGLAGYGDIGSATQDSSIAATSGASRFEIATVSMASRSIKMLRGVPVGGPSFYWSLGADPSNATTVTGPWSMRMYIRCANPGTALTFLSMRIGATTNFSFARASTSERIIRVASGSFVTMPSPTAVYRIEIQADPARTSNLVWRLYQEDSRVALGGVEENIADVSWNTISIGHVNSQIFTNNVDLGEIEIHDDYDLGKQFRSSPQNGVTPASATAEGAPTWNEVVTGRFNYSSSTNKTTTLNSPSFTSYLDVQYATSPANYNRVFDLYVPTGTPPSGGWPVVCWAHGGFFVAGSKADLPEAWRNDLLANGYAVATIQYVKCSTDAVAPYDSYGTSNLGGRYPSFIADFKLACARIRDDASIYSVNSNKMFASGFSAGGYIALAAAMSTELISDSGGQSLKLSTISTGGAAWGGNYFGTDPLFVGALVFNAPIDMDLARNWDRTWASSGSIVRGYAYHYFQGNVSAVDGSTSAAEFPRQAIPSYISSNSIGNLCPVAYVRGNSDYVIHDAHEAELASACQSKGLNYTLIETPNNHDNGINIYAIEPQLTWLNAIAYPQQAPSPDTKITSFYNGTTESERLTTYFDSSNDNVIVFD